MEIKYQEKTISKILHPCTFWDYENEDNYPPSSAIALSIPMYIY
ncbi:hypothetical protein XIS1_690005 [Xenorhabdus innexi]|uniref:Uncharacterized protein n=1 Tax=Xenorhabdus innexi TaxID=290109 RepID=A0A1N6N0I8_9GAMM|nr:hypothetical protein XIS1_690005 [Xenorhabdus innexi]